MYVKYDQASSEEDKASFTLFIRDFIESLFVYIMAYDSSCEEDLNLRFLLEDIPEDRDEVDSVSKHVIDFESRPVLSKYFIDSESRAVKQEATRLRTVSELSSNFEINKIPP